MSSSVPPYRIALLCLLAACGSDPTAPTKPVTPVTPPPPSVPPVDLRFKGVGTLVGRPLGTVNITPGMAQTYGKVFGTALEISPCAPPSGGSPNCSWELMLLGAPPGTADVTAVYYSSETPATFDDNLTALGAGTLTILDTPPQSLKSVVTSLVVDPLTGAYAISGLRTSDVNDYSLRFGADAPAELQAEAEREGARGRVITAVGFRGALVEFLSYGWSRDTTSAYETRTVATPFTGVAAAATSLAGEGYVITALGGDETHGYVLVGTRRRGATTPRPVRIETDSIPSTPYVTPSVTLGLAGYTVLGGIFGGAPGSARQFNLYIGEK
jgi:hypothetical protein